MDRKKIEQWSALAQSNGGGWTSTPAQRLVATGPDALDFLHRMSTHAVAEDAPNAANGFLNVFVDKRGRMVDVAHCQVVSSTKAVMFVEKDAVALRTFLDGFLFMEDAELEVDETPSLLLMGARALSLAATAAGVEGAVAQSTFVGDTAVRAFDVSGPNGDAIPTLLVTSAFASAWRGELDELDPDVVTAARVGAGVPGPEGEVIDAHNPLELALHDAIDWKKGCYIGQEVISRIDNYGKQSKRLVGLTIAEDALGAQVDVGARVFVDGTEVGAVTSATAFDCRSAVVPSALARIKSEPLDGPIGGEVETADGKISISIGPRAAAQEPHD